MNKIVIVVEGGVVQEVKSTEDVEYVIVDEDMKATGDLELPLTGEAAGIISRGAYEKAMFTGTVE